MSPPSSRTAVGMTVVTASPSKATQTTVRRRPAVSERCQERVIGGRTMAWAGGGEPELHRAAVDARFTCGVASREDSALEEESPHAYRGADSHRHRSGVGVRGSGRYAIRPR